MPVVAVGGVGGSGTRVVAAALRDGGWYLGGDLNAALDNLWFTLLFKDPELLSVPDDEFVARLGVFVDRMTGRPVDVRGAGPRVRRLAARTSPQHDRAWLDARADRLLAGGRGAGAGAWGWKEPNTHLVLDRLLVHLPELRYVHVVRNGLDMALSRNQNQATLWGDALGVPYDGTPASSLRYWCVADRRLRTIAARSPDRVLVVQIEQLCAAPERELLRLFDFCGSTDGAGLAARTAPLVQPPASLGRGVRGIDRIAADPADLEYLRSQGFPTSVVDDATLR